MASNGNETVGTGHNHLPPAREAVIEQAQRIHQEVSHERDMLIREVGQLKTDIAGYKVGIEAQASQLAQMESRVMEMTITRDNAVGRRAELEVLVQNVQTLLNAFMSGHKPLVKEAEDEQH